MGICKGGNQGLLAQFGYFFTEIFFRKVIAGIGDTPLLLHKILADSVLVVTGNNSSFKDRHGSSRMFIMAQFYSLFLVSYFYCVAWVNTPPLGAQYLSLIPRPLAAGRALL